MGQPVPVRVRSSAPKPSRGSLGSAPTRCRHRARRARSPAAQRSDPSLRVSRRRSEAGTPLETGGRQREDLGRTRSDVDVLPVVPAQHCDHVRLEAPPPPLRTRRRPAASTPHSRSLSAAPSSRSARPRQGRRRDQRRRLRTGHHYHLLSLGWRLALLHHRRWSPNWSPLSSPVAPTPLPPHRRREPSGAGAWLGDILPL